MVGALIRWALLTLAVWVAASIVPGIEVDHWQGLVMAALVLGILNVFVKPVLKIITLPFILVSFGFVLLLINAGLLKLTAWLVPSFHVRGFWPAVGASLVISIVSYFLGLKGEGRSTIRVQTVRGSAGSPDAESRPPPGRGTIIDVTATEVRDDDVPPPPLPPSRTR